MRTYFDHETLDVYQLEVQFIKWITSILTKLIQRFDLPVSSSSSSSIVREEGDKQIFEDEEEDEKNE